MSTPPPGWHPDPWRTAAWRWWDGTTWTEHASGGTAPTAPGRADAAPIPQGLATPPAPGGPAAAGALGDPSTARHPVPEPAVRHHRQAFERRGSFPLRSQELSRRHARQGLLITGAMLSLFAVVFMGGFVASVADPDSIQRTDDPVAPGLRWVLLVVAAVAAYGAVWAARRRFLIVDTPTVELVGAHPGVCEVVAHARPLDQPATSWFCAAPTIWWEAKVEQRRGSGKRARWVTEWKASGGTKRFVLVDEHGASLEVDATGAGRNGSRQLVSEGIGGRRRVSERALVAGDRLFAIGPVRVTHDGRLRMQKRAEAGSPEHGLPDHRQRAPLWLVQGGDEQQVVRGLNAWTTIATVVSLVALASFTALEAGPDPFGRETLRVREEGGLLRPALVAVGALLLGYLAMYAVRLYNRLTELRWQAAHAWSLIDVAAAARASLITNLVATVQAGAAHERDTQVASATARGGLPRTESVAAVDGAVGAQNRERATLVARVEAHPELGAQALFRQLFGQLVATENRLAASRRFYNDAVTVLADRTATYPGNLLKPLVAPTIPPLLDFDLHTTPAPSAALGGAPPTS